MTNEDMSSTDVHQSHLSSGDARPGTPSRSDVTPHDTTSEDVPDDAEGQVSTHDTMEFLTPEAFAARVQRSKRQVNRYISNGAVLSEVVRDAGRVRILIPASEVDRFLAQKREARQDMSRSVTTSRDATSGRPPVSSDEDMSQSARSHEDSDMSSDATTSGDVARGHGVPIVAFNQVMSHLRVTSDELQRVQEDLRRAECRNVALMMELQQHRHVLEENARSIVEREARAREAEAKLTEVSEAATQAEHVTHQLAALNKQSEALQAEVASETRRRQQLEEEARALRDQLAELEGRRQQEVRQSQARLPWWRRILGGGPARA